MTTGWTTIERQEQRKQSEQLQADNLFTTYVLTGIVADEIYDHLEKNDLLPEKQKGYRKIVEIQRTSC